jgi:hypothetical protein
MLLALLFAQMATDTTDVQIGAETKMQMLSWAACVELNARRYASQSTDVTVLADAALLKCREHESGTQTAWLRDAETQGIDRTMALTRAGGFLRGCRDALLRQARLTIVESRASARKGPRAR